MLRFIRASRTALLLITTDALGNGYSLWDLRGTALKTATCAEKFMYFA